MPRSPQEQIHRIGDYWLSQRGNSDNWCRTWFDAGTRQTRRASLGTDDLEEAKHALARWVTENVGTRNANPGDVPVATVFARYQAKHGQFVRSGVINARNLLLMLEALPVGLMVGAAGGQDARVLAIGQAIEGALATAARG